MFDAYVDLSDPLCHSQDVPQYTYSPKYSGFPQYNQHGVNIPGTWTGSSAPFVNLAYVCNINKAENRRTSSAFEMDDVLEEMVDAQAICSAFGVLMPMASNLGFDPFNDPTRPLSTNVIISDGCNFKFAAYQLNKTELADANKERQVSIKDLYF